MDVFKPCLTDPTIAEVVSAIAKASSRATALTILEPFQEVPHHLISYLKASGYGVEVSRHESSLLRQYRIHIYWCKGASIGQG